MSIKFFHASSLAVFVVGSVACGGAPTEEQNPPDESAKAATGEDAPAAIAAPARASSSGALGLPIRLPPRSTWQDESLNATCMLYDSSATNTEPGADPFCKATASVGSYEIFIGGTGVSGNGLFEADSPFAPGTAFYFPFACNDMVTCVPLGEQPCCPTQVQGLQIDEQGTVWWVNGGTHHIHYYIPGSSSDVDLDALIGVDRGYDSFVWSSVAAGAPLATSTNGSPSGQIWGVTSGGQIYALAGYLEDGLPSEYSGWVQIPGSATAIAFMNETNPSSFCSSNWYLPWVINSAAQIFKYVPYGDACFDGSWQQLDGAAVAITGNDVVLGTGTNPTIYKWDDAAGSFYATLQPSLPAGVQIATVGAQSGTSVIEATDTLNNVWQETCRNANCQ